MPLFKFSQSVQGVSFNFTSSGYSAPAGDNVDFTFTLGIVAVDALPFEYILDLSADLQLPYKYVDALPFEYILEAQGEAQPTGWFGTLLGVSITGPQKIYGIEAYKIKSETEII
jgi:hypothetical protein